MKNMPEKDNQMLMQIISKCYLKYQDSIIKNDDDSIMELNIKLLMAMSLDQNIQNNKAWLNKEFLFWFQSKAYLKKAEFMVYNK